MSKDKTSVANLRQKFESVSEDAESKSVVGHQPTETQPKPQKLPNKPKLKSHPLAKDDDRPALKPKPPLKPKPTNPPSKRTEDVKADVKKVSDYKDYTEPLDDSDKGHSVSARKEKLPSTARVGQESNDLNESLDDRGIDRSGSPEMVLRQDRERSLHLDITGESESGDFVCIEQHVLRDEKNFGKQTEECVPFAEQHDYYNQSDRNLTTNERNKKGDSESETFVAVEEVMRKDQDQLSHQEGAGKAESLDNSVIRESIHLKTQADSHVLIQEQGDNDNQSSRIMTINEENKEEENLSRSGQLEVNANTPEMLIAAQKNVARNPGKNNVQAYNDESSPHLYDNNKKQSGGADKGNGQLRIKQHREDANIVPGDTLEIYVAAAKENASDVHSDSETESSSSRSSPSGNSDGYRSDSGLSAGESYSDDDNDSSKTVIYLDQIEYMIETYLPFIKHKITVTDVLDHLDFINDRERDIILSKHSSCASDAFERLISVIKRSTTKGKWQTFLKALDTNEFQYIKELIEGKTEVHHHSNSQLLRLVTPELVKRLHAQVFLDRVYEKELLTADDKSVVEARLREHGEHQAIKVTLEKVDKHKKYWNRVLIDIFKQEEFCLGDIAELFEFIEQREEEVPIKEATELSLKRLDSVNKAREWHQRHHAEREIKNSTNNGNDSQVKLENLHEEFVTNGATSYVYPTFDKSFPTHQDFVDLISEIRKLRKLLNRQEQRIPPENY